MENTIVQIPSFLFSNPTHMHHTKPFIHFLPTNINTSFRE
uniref:Uncharacterized protein n=1 Tax=Manihot esculenta TaxID=3983 RepID=A0A2C9VB29_MANES